MSLTPSFLVCVLFPFLAKLLWLGLSIQCWIKMVRVNTPVSFLILKEKLCAFQSMLLVGLSYMTFIQLRYITSTTILLRLFMLHFVKCFFSTYWDHPMIFVLHVVNMVYHTDLNMVSLLWIPGINPTWSWYMIFLKKLLNLVFQYFVQHFCIYTHQDDTSL